ncbi:MAG: triose-phosphate isomerase [Proteobacteria bacterium]|nr:triose-phosphate isomerase [Pseudomonadota bacterium]
MNGSRAEWRALAAAVVQQAQGVAADFVVCPPAAGLADVATVVQGAQVALGTQDVCAHGNGAHTGEVSTTMLKEFGCTYAIVGHSERRTDLAETDGLVAAKARAALAEGIVPIICIGETEDQKTKGLTTKVLDGQLRGSLKDVRPARAVDIVIAYEPVWAIGTGKVPTAADITEACAHIRSLLIELLPDTGKSVRILYGGSVKPENAAEILTLANVDGALIGGASLKAESFVGIARAVVAKAA